MADKTQLPDDVDDVDFNNLQYYSSSIRYCSFVYSESVNI